MTTKLETSRRPAKTSQPADVDPHVFGVNTDEGTLSIAALETIEDMVERGVKAAALARTSKNLADVARSTRDIGALILVKPFDDAQKPYDAAIKRINRKLEAGKMDAKEAFEAKVEASETRRKAMRDVKYKPANIWRPIGVSRGLFARMKQRETVLPTASEYLADVMSGDKRMRSLITHTLTTKHGSETDAVVAVAQAKTADCKLYDAIFKAASDIRDEIIIMLLNGNPKIGRPAMSNADVARLMKLTTPRIHQIRYGTR